MDPQLNIDGPDLLVLDDGKWRPDVRGRVLRHEKQEDEQEQ
jgi:hypothetical protein